MQVLQRKLLNFAMIPPHVNELKTKANEKCIFLIRRTLYNSPRILSSFRHFISNLNFFSAANNSKWKMTLQGTKIEVRSSQILLQGNEWQKHTPLPLSLVDILSFQAEEMVWEKYNPEKYHNARFWCVKFINESLEILNNYNHKVI